MFDSLHVTCSCVHYNVNLLVPNENFVPEKVLKVAKLKEHTLFWVHGGGYTDLAWLALLYSNTVPAALLGWTSADPVLKRL